MTKKKREARMYRLMCKAMVVASLSGRLPDAHSAIVICGEIHCQALFAYFWKFLLLTSLMHSGGVPDLAPA
jgi:hypothetical protein